MRKPFRGTKLKISRLLTRGIVLAMPFYEGTGTRVIDLSGNGNHGAINGPTWTPGKDGPALEFPGTNEYVSTVFNTSAVGASNTVSAWIYIDAHKNYNMIWSAASNFFEMYFSSNGQIAFNGKERRGGALFASGVSAGIWCHVALVETPDKIVFYLNGQETLTGTDSMSVGDTTVNLGFRTGGSWYFDGKISQCLIHNRNLAAIEIQQLYSEPHAMWELADIPYARVAVAAAHVGKLVNARRLKSKVGGGLI